MRDHRAATAIVGLRRHSLHTTLVAVALAAAGCNDSHAPQPPADATFNGRFDAAQSVLELQLQSSQGEPSQLRLIVTDLVSEADSQRVRAQVAIRNTGGTVLAGPAGIQVDGFVPADVVPLNATCARASCVFDHSGTYGEDGQLSPDETSAPVEWIFSNPTNESFAFRARVARDPLPRAGIVAGTVFADHNGNGVRERGEPGLEGASVTLEGDFGSRTAVSDASGRYRFQVEEPGHYRLIFGCPGCASPPYPCTPTTPGELQVVIIRRSDGSLSEFPHGNFGCLRPGPGQPRVHGTVWEDTDRDGKRDSREARLAGIQITAQSVHCDVPAVTTTTGSDGKYELVLPGCAPWTVERESRAGYEGTTPNPVTLPRTGGGGDDDDKRDDDDDDEAPSHRVDFGLAPVPPR